LLDAGRALRPQDCPRLMAGQGGPTRTAPSHSTVGTRRLPLGREVSSLSWNRGIMRSCSDRDILVNASEAKVIICLISLPPSAKESQHRCMHVLPAADPRGLSGVQHNFCNPPSPLAPNSTTTSSPLPSFSHPIPITIILYAAHFSTAPFSIPSPRLPCFESQDLPAWFPSVLIPSQIFSLHLIFAILIRCAWRIPLGIQ